MWVWLVVLDMVVLEHTPSLPCPHTFSPVHPYILFNFSLMCLFAYFLMALIGHQVLNANLSSVPTTSINALILTSAVLCTLAYLVFHFRNILRTRGKPESRSWFTVYTSEQHCCLRCQAVLESGQTHNRSNTEFYTDTIILKCCLCGNLQLL